MSTTGKSVYEIVTERIIAAVEQADVLAPWRKTWRSSVPTLNGKKLRFPMNAVSGKAYKGLNVFMLNLGNYADPRFVTYNQAKTLGGNVVKGENGWPVVFWKWLDVKDDKTGEDKKIPMLRYYTVFNVAQCENLSKLKPLDAEPVSTQTEAEAAQERHEAAEAVLAGRQSVVEVFHGGEDACYNPTLDRIYMPSPAKFESLDSYYATRFHEEIHATGFRTRLARPGIVEFDSFGSDKYSREELIAEMGAAFLCANCGIDSTLDNSAAYLKGWLSKLKADPKMLVVSAGAAQKAADFILGEPEEAKEEEA